MLKRLLSLLPLMVLVLALVLDVSPARAQDPEPTSTPVYSYDITLPSGTHVEVVRTITYGEIAVVVAVMAVTVCFIAFFLISVVRKWLR